MSSRTVHIERSESGDRVTVRVELRTGRICEASFPANLQPLELSNYLEQVRQVVTRRWRPSDPPRRG